MLPNISNTISQGLRGTQRQMLPMCCRTSPGANANNGAKGPEMLSSRQISLIWSPLILFPGLFNLRSSDIPYNPFFYSYTLLTNSSIRYHFSLASVTNFLQFSPSPCPTSDPTLIIVFRLPMSLASALARSFRKQAFPNPLTFARKESQIQAAWLPMLPSSDL